MAVLAEAISVVFKCQSIEEKYEGGAKAFAAFCRQINNSYCCDGELARQGFTTPDAVKKFVEKVAFFGLKHVRDGQAVDLVVVDQRAGPMQRCDWIDFGIADLPGEPSPKVAACRLAGSSLADVTVPEGWRYESSIARRVAKDVAADAARAERAKAEQAKAGLALYAKPKQAQPPLELMLGLRRVKK